MNEHFFIMLKPVFIFGVLGVLLIPVQSEQITVCLEEDNDLRVDCLIEPVPNKIASYEFSWSSGMKETIINTNVSGSPADVQFRDKSYVEQREPHGYRMTLSGFTDTLPHNTTYLCKMSGVVARVYKENSQILQCSAVSMLLRSTWCWILFVLLYFFYHSHS